MADTFLTEARLREKVNLVVSTFDNFYKERKH